jgi:hypothetical protein
MIEAVTGITTDEAAPAIPVAARSRRPSPRWSFSSEAVESTGRSELDTVGGGQLVDSPIALWATWALNAAVWDSASPPSPPLIRTPGIEQLEVQFSGSPIGWWSCLRSDHLIISWDWYQRRDRL